MASHLFGGLGVRVHQNRAILCGCSDDDVYRSSRIDFLGDLLAIQNGW